MEYSTKGLAALDASDAQAALGYFTQALCQHPTSPDYFTQRSTAFVRLKPPRHDLALKDAEYAVLCGQRRQKREKIQAAQHRRMVALYGLGRYGESKQVLDSMLKWRPKDSKKDKMEHDMWMARLTSKMKSRDTETQAAEVVKEFPDVTLPSEKELKVWLQSQLKTDGTFRFDGEQDSTPLPTPSAKTVPGQDTPTAITVDKQDEATKVAETETIAPVTKPQVSPIRQDWYQDNNSVTVTFYAKKVDASKLKSEFTEDSVQLSFPHPDTPDEIFSVAFDPTFASIDSVASTVKAFGAKVELKLIKKEKGIKWPALDDKSRPKEDKLPNAWTTKGGQDWDKKVEELTKKEPKGKGKAKEKDSGDDVDSDADSDTGGDAVDGFFKKLYKDADPDTRRAMMKSFQESNGTALSTNWAEVSKGKVDEVKGKDS